MNRIILIGNGFDLAHGLKTSYRDFIDDFWKQKKREIFSYYIKTCREYHDDENYIPWEDSIFTDAYIKSCKEYRDDIIDIILSDVPPDVDYCIDHSDRVNHLFPIMENDYNWLNKIQKLGAKIEHRNVFLKTISEKAWLQNWVDIEEEYYLALTKCLKDASGEEVKKLNNEFSFIITQLENYLKEQILNEISVVEKIRQHIYSNPEPDVFIKTPKVASLNKILFLNFNYTNTERLYTDNSGYNTETIHIHGEIRSSGNPILFGYGDEIGDEYKNIESRNDNNYLENMKSINYFKTDNYNRLLRFAESDDYEIFVMGHSCGNSDRTLLNTLFANSGCLSIRIFYYQRNNNSDNYIDIIKNMSRCFSNKIYNRHVIVEKSRCKSLS